MRDINTVTTCCDLMAYFSAVVDDSTGVIAKLLTVLRNMLYKVAAPEVIWGSDRCKTVYTTST